MAERTGSNRNQVVNTTNRNRPPKKPSKKSSSSSKAVIVFLLFAAIITVFSMAISNTIANSANNPQHNLHTLKTIETVVRSGTSGQEHRIMAKVVVAMYKKSKSKVTTNMLNELVADAAKELDYDKLTDFDSVEYMEAEVLNALGRSINIEDIAGVYVTDMSTGSFDIIASEPQGGSSRSDVMKGLFKNMD